MGEYETTDGLARFIRRRLDEKFDFSAAITGSTGIGKTTFSIRLAQSLQKITKTPFAFGNNLFYGNEDFYDAIDYKLPTYSAVIGDETINLLFNRQSMRGKNVDLVQLLNMCRYRRLCLLMNIPRFWNLDKAARDDWVQCRIIIPQRGWAVVFVRDSNPDARDPWRRKLGEKLFVNFQEGWQAKVERHPLYHGTIRYDVLSPQEELEYERVRQTKRRQAQQAEAQRETSTSARTKLELLREMYGECKERLCVGCVPVLKEWAVGKAQYLR